MRLEKIKLSGFKSFVDSTNIIFPGRLIGIVGPNGCGKSNVLDAVRWVMGENSVRQLRGDSLTDVIFNGSKNRKPVSRAMIELIFDNHDASIGGEYAQYSQISIRRVIDREGQSSYFLNNVRCRRRDIAGLFLGTGLGSNGYAMIEQGMISRLIEAKPEELRGYIEEAAGISRYKERRKETENRIKHTQENMLRINDLEEELNKQIEHLKHQAKTAERYKKLKEQERLMKARLLVVRWLKLNEEVSQLQVSIEQSKNLLESYHAELQEINTNIEKQRIVQVEGQDAFYAIQNRYQALNADIARIEQAIDHQNQKKQQLTFDLNQVIENLQKTECTLKQDETSIVTLTKTIEDLQPQFEKINQNLQISDQILSTIEQSIRCWQNEWDDFHQKASCVLQTVQVQQTRIEHLKQQSLQFDQQLEKIENEYRGLNIQQLHEELLQLNDQMEKVVLIIQLQEKKASVNLNSINKQRKCHTQYEMELNELYQRLHIARERHMSLQVLQRNALGETQEELTAWLRQHQLHDKPKLVKDLSVESGWEVAVETVLQPYLNAICVDGLHHVVQALHSLDQGSVTLFDVCSDVVESSCGDKAPVLSAKIKSSKWIGHLLEKIYIAESITEALSLWKTLNSHESVVTKDGIWIGKNWIKVNRGINAQSGFIAREKELNEAQNEVDCCTNLIARVEEKLRIGKEKLKQLEQRCDELQSTLLIDQKDYADIVSQKNLRQVQIVHMEKRYQYLDTESTEIKQRQERCQQDLKEALNLLQEAMQIKEQHECLKETLLSQRNQLYIALDEEKVKNEKMKSLKNQLNLNLESAKTKSETLHTAVDRIKQQMVVLLERQKQLSKSLEKEQCPVQQFESELEKVLQQRIESEEALKVAKQRASGFEEEMQTLVQKQRCSMDRIQKLQQILEEKKLHMQELKVRQTTLQEQLTEIRFDIEELLEQMSREETSEAECSAKIEKIKIQLEKLGAINLAAIQEYETLNERQGYLSKQKSDLEEALTTLQNAICKIDGETRNRFKETFEKLNHHFQILFPKIFGGGQAYLELTSQNLLESGVILMAKPPGKCIKSTSLMSGGEKALTAIALVFSLFQLNPAPFCLLDEVDAPLDEVNIGHFCNLLKEMAEKIQLIFISHNKNTIEVAEYLTGITMKEPGVSNVLAVDIDQALMMAEA